MNDTAKIEYALSLYFNYRRNIIVPNVWWGLGLNHECDVFVVTKSGMAYEIEIKTSKSDLKRDVLKRHGHHHNKIRKLYFAIPEQLSSEIEYIPEHAGILIMNDSGIIKKIREAKLNLRARALSAKEILKVAHLGSMRIWKLKQVILYNQNQNH